MIRRPNDAGTPQESLPWAYASPLPFRILFDFLRRAKLPVVGEFAIAAMASLNAERAETIHGVISSVSVDVVVVERENGTRFLILDGGVDGRESFELVSRGRDVLQHLIDAGGWIAHAGGVGRDHLWISDVELRRLKDQLTAADRSNVPKPKVRWLPENKGEP